MEQSISKKAVWQQLKADLIGKDSYRGVTLTYSWCANQVGHFSLGFIPTVLISKPINRFTSFNDIPNSAATIISLFLLLFELYNFLGPLLKKKKEHVQAVFSPPWKNIAFDTFTDLCFFWLGAFCASLFLGYSNIGLIMVILFLIILVYPASFWYLRKMYLQAAQLPFQFRLSQWEGSLKNKEKEIIERFIKRQSHGNHLFVFGEKASGKTSLAVGIASEWSMKRMTCLYTTGVKLLPLFFELEVQKNENANQIWNWRKASLLVVDDMNPGEPVQEDFMSPTHFLNIVDTHSASNIENRNALKNKNVIWVLGDRKQDPVLFTKWKKMLQQIGVVEENISSIHLK